MSSNKRKSIEKPKGVKEKRNTKEKKKAEWQRLKKELGENTTFWSRLCINEGILGHLYLCLYSCDTEFIQTKALS